MSTETQVVKQEQTPSTSHSERFTATVMKEFAGISGEGITISNFQRKLIKNYFIKLDAALKIAESKRLSTKEEYRSDLEYSWKNVNMNKLAVDTVSFSSIGLDPILPNQVFLIPYKNSKTKQFDVDLQIGYVGLEIKAKKYGLDVPDNTVVKVVYANDKFIPYMKDKDNDVENYEFKVEKPFDRGEIVGGFYFHEFTQAKHKNKLVFYSLDQIIKRRPDSASPEFWGGEKEVWVEKNGKKSKEKQQVEGWFDEMVYKTLVRACYSSITVDSEKIDDHYLRMLEADQESSLRIPETTESKVSQQIADEGNKKEINFTEDAEHEEIVEEEKQPESPAETKKEEAPAPEKKKTSVLDQKVPSAEIKAESGNIEKLF